MMRAALWLSAAAVLVAVRGMMPDGPTANALEPSAPAQAASKAANASPPPSAGPRQATQWACSPEQLAELQKRAKRLKEHEDRLALREKRLAEAEARAKELAALLQAKLEAIEARLAEERKLKDKKIQRLAAVYAAMKPEQAARVVARLDLTTAVRIFSVMEEKRVGKILSHLSPELAVRISRALSGASSR